MKVLNLEKLLPSDLQPGEEILWFGKPDATSLWRRAYRADVVATYFAALAIWGFFASAPMAEPGIALEQGLINLGLGVAVLAILGALALFQRAHDALCRHHAADRAEERHGAADLP